MDNGYYNPQAVLAEEQVRAPQTRTFAADYRPQPG